MSFLRCLPSVFVIGNEYEILLNANENGIFAVRIDEATYYEENAGALSSEKSFAKIRVPQQTLDSAKAYTVTYRKSIDRKAYFSKLGEEQTAAFSFKPLTKTEDINLYHIADVHYRFELAKKTAAYFGEDTDLFVVNGDIGEVETEENYFEVAKFVGEISGGKIPVIFARGNHDTRGKLAERFTDYFPAIGKNTYFTFTVGSLSGVVIDCGEDKLDVHAEYGGVNQFEPFRRRQTEFLKALAPFDGHMTFAVSHICPAQIAHEKDSIFCIDEEVYAEWNKELGRIGVRFMLSGHDHNAYILEKNDKLSLLPHEYPAIIGSACFGDEDFWGAALTLREHLLTVRFTDSKKNVREEYQLNLDTGTLIPFQK